jgi:hypothetical protein
LGLGISSGAPVLYPSSSSLERGGMGLATAPPSTSDIEHSIFDISDAVQAPQDGRTREMSNVEFPSSGTAPMNQPSHNPAM